MSRRANENSLQRDIVDYINNRSTLPCKLSRIKNQGTYDPTRMSFRRNSTEKGIPDLIGVKEGGIAVFIEVKMLRNNGSSSAISPEQVEYLEKVSSFGAIVGIAYDLSDAFDIVVDDPIRYPRKERTYGNRKLRAILAKGTPHEVRQSRTVLTNKGRVYREDLTEDHIIIGKKGT